MCTEIVVSSGNFAKNEELESIYLQGVREGKIMSVFVGPLLENRASTRRTEKLLCPICHDTLFFNAKKVVRACATGHYMHKRCLAQWCDSQSENGRVCTCPECRGVVTWTGANAQPPPPLPPVAAAQDIWGAIWTQDAVRVRHFLQTGYEAHADGGAALVAAADAGDPEVVRALLEAGADVHADDDDALRTAAAADQADVLAVLLAAGAHVHACEDEAFRVAVEHGNGEAVYTLLAAGADVRVHDDFPLITAAGNGYLSYIEDFLNAGANVHAQTEMPLRAAAALPDVNREKRLIMDKLVEWGADAQAAVAEATRERAGERVLQSLRIYADRAMDADAVFNQF